MTQYRTNNPLGSMAPRDLYDNAQNIDNWSNGPEPFYEDRVGVMRRSFSGMNFEFEAGQTGRGVAFDQSQADKESRFQAFLVSSGYVSKGDYAAGVVLAGRNEYVAVDAATTGTSPGLYRPNASATVPLTLTGIWATDAANLVLLGDDVLRQELADPAQGAWKIGYRGRTQAQRNEDQPSVYDYDGATFQQRLEAAINAGGPLTIPKGRYVLEPFTLTNESKISIFAHGAVFVPAGSGKLFNFGARSASFSGGVFDLSGLPGVSSDYALYFNGSEEVELESVKFIGGGHGVFARKVGTAVIDNCLGNGAKFWHFYIEGCESAFVTRNRVFNGAYDGLKLGGVEASGEEIVTRDVLLQGNVTGGNARDGIDFALNVGGSLIVASNISRNDLLKGIDGKVVYQSSAGLEDPMFMGNIAIKKGIPVDVGLNVQSNVANGRIIRPQIIGNKAFADGVGASGAALRLDNTDSAYVFGNVGVGYHHGVRLTGAAIDTHIEQNSYSKCVHGVQSQAGVTGIPSNTVITRNRFNCIGHASGANGSAVRLDEANATQIYENDWTVSNSSYAVDAENSNRAATGTIIGKNYRGFSQTLPTGQRAVVGETWRNNSTELGSPAEWVCMTQTNDTGASSVYGMEQRGFRTVAGSPVSVLTPQFRQERVYDTTNERWWVSFGTGSANWA